MGLRLARGFPPRSKWTYREVFHPAVVPPPPFIKLFLFFVVHNNGNVCVPQLFKQVLLGSQVPGLKFFGLSFY